MGYVFGFLVFAILALLSMLETKNETLKEEVKENYDLEDENYNLKKKIDDLKEENKSLKEMVIEFKGGERTNQGRSRIN
jgi:cell division protein FtsB